SPRRGALSLCRATDARPGPRPTSPLRWLARRDAVVPPPGEHDANAPRSVPMTADRLRVTVAPDGMTATAERSDAQPMARAELDERLAAANVRFGLDEAACERLLAHDRDGA